MLSHLHLARAMLLLIYDVYAIALERCPACAKYSSNRGQVIGAANLDLEKTMFVANFAQRAEFLQK